MLGGKLYVLDVAGDAMKKGNTCSLLSTELFCIGLRAIGEDLMKREVIHKMLDIVTALAFDVVWESLLHSMELSWCAQYPCNIRFL
jgi:hypothetical protein